MERERQTIPLQKAEKTDWLIRQYSKAIYGVGVLLCLAFAVGGTVVEVKRAVEGDFGKPLATEKLPENLSPSQKIITDVPYGLDIVVTGGAVVGLVGLGIVEGHRRLWLGKLMKLGNEPNN